jgi:hypothetical protein
MQMAQATFAVDVIGVSAGSGDAGVDGLSALPDHDEIVDHTCPERSEHIFPGLGQRNFAGAKSARQILPGITRSPSLGGFWLAVQRFESVVSHAHTRYRRGSLHGMLFPAGLAAHGHCKKDCREWNKIPAGAL